ncbi:MAG: NFACT family protein [Treponema sp.]|jgi:predicted ribosome quality control (RQC) complex YloA/Tae2 family protein|nr:NFACT family protein [Treponema sp.]
MEIIKKVCYAFFVSLNWKEINLILDELDLAGSRIQKVFQGDFNVLALEIFGRTGTQVVLVSLVPGGCRINRSSRPVPKTDKPLRFAQFLKSRVVNGRVEEASQLGDNRIVRLLVRRGEIRYRIYIRLWSNAANVIVTGEDGVILDAMKRLPKRKEVSGGSYRPEETLGEKTERNAENDEKYAVRELPGNGSFNEKIDTFYAEQGGELSLEKLREKAEWLIGGSVNRLEASLERLREKEEEYKNAARWKEYGDIIMANASGIAPGSAWLEAADFFSPENKTIRIELDTRKSPAENAELCYEKYRKGKNGLKNLQEEIKDGETELIRLKETKKKLLLETNPLILKGLLRKIHPGSGGTRNSAGIAEKGAEKRTGLSFRDGDWSIIVGRDARENDELLRRHVRGNDLWLHARDYAGAYVFIKHRSGKTAPLDILLDAGNLALFYSKGRNNGYCDCYYTQAKYLRRVKNGPKGKVIPTQEKNISIKLDQKRLKKLEEARIRY